MRRGRGLGSILACLVIGVPVVAIAKTAALRGVPLGIVVPLCMAGLALAFTAADAVIDRPEGADPSWLRRRAMRNLGIAAFGALLAFLGGLAS